MAKSWRSESDFSVASWRILDSMARISETRLVRKSILTSEATEAVVRTEEEVGVDGAGGFEEAMVKGMNQKGGKG